jgi:2-dehydropantoate 2-reductase
MLGVLARLHGATILATADSVFRPRGRAITTVLCEGEPIGTYGLCWTANGAHDCGGAEGAMRYVIYGAGAIGATLGACLHENGHEVALIARGAHHDALAAGGLVFQTPERTAKLRLPVVDHPAALDLGSDDVVVLAVKSHQTAAALAELSEAAPAEIAVACAQNGVDNERAALRLFPNVYGVCVMCMATHLQPGVVSVASWPTIGIFEVGRYPSGVDARAERLSAALDGSSCPAQVRPDVMAWKYTKLLINLANVVLALVGEPSSGRLTELARAEGVACLEAAGISCVGTPTWRERYRSLRRHPDARDPTEGSTWQSLARRTGSIETDFLNGEVVLLGRLFGVPTPINAHLQRLATEVAKRGDPPGGFSEDQLLEKFGA